MKKYNNYSAKEYRNLSSDRIIIPNNSNSIIDFFFESIYYNSNRKMYLSKIDDKMSRIIYEITGENVQNYNISLKTDIVRKIYKSHGNMIDEYLRGQMPVLIEDFELITTVINNPDYISLSNKKTKQGKSVLLFRKKYDYLLFIVVYISDKHHNLEIQTMYKIKRTLPL